MARYKINGIEYPSVTEILGLRDKSDALIPWATGLMGAYIRQNAPIGANGALQVPLSLIDEAQREFRAVSQTALDVGSAVHKGIEDYVKTGVPIMPEDVDPAIYNGFAAFLQWEQAHSVAWEENEATVVDEIHGYAGTTDAVAIVDGKRLIVDFKTSKSIYPEYWMQAAAYRFARMSMAGTYYFESREAVTYSKTYDQPQPIEGVGILRVDKITGQPEWVVKTDLVWIGRKLDSFRALLNHYYLDADRKLAGNPIAAKIKAAYK